MKIIKILLNFSEKFYLINAETLLKNRKKIESTDKAQKSATFWRRFDVFSVDTFFTYPF